jgi:hypothetical protein
MADKGNGAVPHEAEGNGAAKKTAGDDTITQEATQQGTGNGSTVDVKSAAAMTAYGIDFAGSEQLAGYPLAYDEAYEREERVEILEEPIAGGEKTFNFGFDFAPIDTVGSTVSEEPEIKPAGKPVSEEPEGPYVCDVEYERQERAKILKLAKGEGYFLPRDWAV